jgi:hypothetical protein
MQDIQRTIKRLNKEIELLVKSCLELSWYSRGAWPYDQVLQMSAGERDVAFTFINKRLEQQQKVSYPVY